MRRSAELSHNLKQRSRIGLARPAFAFAKHGTKILYEIELLKDFDRKFMVLVGANPEPSPFAMELREKLTPALINCCVRRQILPVKGDEFLNERRQPVTGQAARAMLAPPAGAPRRRSFP